MADDSSPCTVEAIHALTTSVCEYVNENCNDEELIRFTYFYFCKVSENILILDILTVLIPMMCFHLLSSTAENYLSPSLAKLAQIFKLSETVAGVTLLALGNGAPDVITAVVAGGGDDDGISIAIGSIFGAGLFVTTATLAVVIQNGKIIKIEKRTFMRDVLFYLVGSIIILIFAIVKVVNIYMSASFMSIYLIFLGIVIYQDRLQKKELEQLGIDENEIQMQLQKSRKNSISSEKRNQSVGVILYQQEYQNDINTLHYENQEPFNVSREEESVSQMDDEEEVDDGKINGSTYTKKANYKKVQVAKTAIKMRFQFQNLKHAMKQKYYSFKGEFSEMSVFEKIVYFYEIPVDLIRDLTVPPAEDEQWNKWRAILCCYTTPIFFLFMIGKIDMTVGDIDGFYVVYLLLGIGFIGSILVWKYSHPQKAPGFLWIFSLLAFIISIAYISQIAQILIDFITFFQILTNINKTFLGMTLLAYGNSSGDFFTNAQLAKMGYGVMAVTGCFAGQTFNLFLGFGFALVLQTKSSNYDFSLFTASSLNEWINNGIAIAILLLTIISTAITFIVSKKLNYTFEKGYFSSFLIYYYTVSIVICLGLCIADQAIPK